MLIKRDVDGKAQSFPNGEVPAIIGTFTYTAKRMGGAPSITATIYYPTPLDKQWTHAEYVEFQGERYYATSIPSSSKDNQSVLYKHYVTFTSRREILDNTLFFDAVSNKDEDTKGGDRYRTNQTRFSFGGDITEFVSRINSSMKYCDVPYSVVIDDGYATTDVKEVSFENQYLTEVLQLINTTYQLDYYWAGNVCHVGKLQYDLTDNPMEYGRNDALVSVSKENSNARIVDMITGYGSSDNIPYYYPNDDEFGKADYISENINEPIAISLPQLQKNANIGADYAKKYTLYKREGALKATIKIDGSFFGTMPSSKLVVADGMDFDRMAIIPIVAKKGMKIYEPKITVSHHTRKSGVSIKSDVFSFYMDNETEGNYDGSYTFTNDRYAALVIWEKITIKSTIGDVAVDESISYNYIGSVEIEYENQSKAFWLFDGGVIEYESSGISVNNIDNVTSAKSLVTFEKIPNAYNTSFWWGFKETYDTSTEEAAAKITIKGRTWIFPSQNLMPSVYRESGGAERFYYAKNDTYSIPGATDKYTFKNIYKEGNPHQGSVEFSDIKPTINGVRNDVIQSDGLGQLFGEIADVAFDSNDSDVKNDDSEYIHSYFYIKLHKFSGSYGFDLFKHALASESAKINLIKSNGCPACSFDIQCVPSKDKSKMYNCVSTDGHGNLKSVRDDCNDYIFKNEEDAYKDTFNQDSTKTELWIAVKKDDSTLGIIMPNASGNFKPQKGDLFVITGINPPKVLVTAAEKRLDEALIKYMSENNEDKFNYSVKFSRIFLQENMAFANKLNENSKVAITYAGEKHEFFVTNYTVKVDDSALADVEIELSDTLDASSSELKKVIDAVKGDTVAQLNGLIGGSGGLNATIANRLYLSKQDDDTAQGLITFVKGLISDALVKLKGGATFGTRGYKFDENGNVVVDALSSLTFDEALERGFGITKNAQGKYTLSVTDLMVWGKAVFNSLEIRKLYAVGGNVYLSGASSKIVRAVPVKKATAAASSTGGDASETWVACAEGDADCEGWKCYTLNDDGTTATQNGWRKYDQAKCQTFDIEAGTHEGVSNTYYWRLVADVSTKNETITETRTEAYVDDDGVTKTREVTVDLYDGKKFGWVVLSKTDCESTTNDAPKAGDTIVLDGHRMFASGDAEGRDQYNDESRTNVMMLETTGTEDGTLPRIVALTGIVDYRHWDGVNHYSNTVFILSPKEVVFVSSCFKFIGASGDPITLVNFRGNWEEGKEYAYYDQVSHNDSIWTCIVEKGKKTTEEPSDTSKVWRKEISGGKGEKGDKGKDAVTYGVQLSSTYEVFSDAKKHAGIKVAYTKTTGMTVSSYGNVQVLGTAKVYADGTEIKSASDHLKDGYDRIIFDYYTFDGTNNTASIGTASVITVELLVGDTVVATANYSNGKQGADGKGALEIICDPETIVLDTDDNGLVTDYTNARASLMCLRDGKVVDNVTYNIGEHDTVNCEAKVNNVGVVKITKVNTQTVTIDSNTVTVSCTSGSVTVSVTENATGVTYMKTVPFTVNMARYTGGLKADNKKFESAYNYLTNNGNSTDFSYYESKIRQTAKEISLKVSEKSVGRRNMLVGSACRKYGDGFVYMNGRYYDGYPLEQIEINNGIDGVNCIHVRAKQTVGDDGFRWNGISPQGNIKLEKGKNYVLSFYAKTHTPNDINFIAEVLYQGSKTDTSRPAGYDGPTGHSTTFSASEADKWELFTVKISVPSDAQYEYVEINIFARASSDSLVDAYICKPMLEEGEEYNGWTLSEQDYDYVGGNLLDNAGTLTKTGNVDVLDETTVTQGGYNNESAIVGATLSPTAAYNDFLQYSTTGMGLKAGEDCMLSFYARSDSKGLLQCYLYDPSTGNVMTESSNEKINDVWNPNDGNLRTPIAPATEWKRYWVHWRPMGNVPKHILLRLLRPGTNKGSYNSSTSYNVGDVVLYGGTYYVCRKAGQGNTPSSSSSYWEASWFSIEIARPKLEVGATMTEWTEKRADMVDKQALYATGIDIDSKKITLTADHTYVRNNDGDPKVMIDSYGNLTNVTVNADIMNVSATHQLRISGNGAMVVDMDNFKLDASGNASFKGSIESTSGRISFFTFTDSGMYSTSSSSLWGIGLRSTNISVRGNPGGRTSLVSLGDGHRDTTGGDADTYPTSLVNGQNVNYCNLIQVKGGGTGNGRDAAALGIETDGDFCLSAMGGLSHLQGLALDASTTTNGSSPNRTLFLCSGGRFTMPSNPKDGQLVIAIQTTGSRIDFNGNGHRFQSGTYNSLSFTSDSSGQWSLFYYHNGVWYTIYMTC